MAFLDLEEIEVKEPVPGFKVRFVHSERMTFGFFDIEKGASLHEHSHPHEQVSTVLEGEFELTIDGQAQIMVPGKTAVIPSDAPHSGKALTNCKIIDVFSPVREDYR